MISIDAEAVPVGYAVYTATELNAHQELKTAAPAAGTVLPAAADSATIIVSGSACYALFDGNNATTSGIKLAVGTYNFINCRSALAACSLLRSDASTRVDIIYLSINGR